MTRKNPTASNIPINVPSTNLKTCKTRSSDWEKQLSLDWKKAAKEPAPSQACLLRSGIRCLVQNAPTSLPPSLLSTLLPGHPFDAHLLSLSPIYRTSRNLFKKRKGIYLGSLNSSPRTLSSNSLLSDRIEYSPIEQEYIWAATDRIQSKKPEYLLTLRGYISNLFHEQNHRILWSFLPKPQGNLREIYRYLNFAESLIITLDMALSDELGAQLGSLFHLCGVVYDPGTEIRKEIQLPRDYRNYLQAATYSTYLYLEQFEKKKIPPFIRSLFPQCPDLAERAAHRSLVLDQEFVNKTNPIWQSKNAKAALEYLRQKSGETLTLSSDPKDTWTPYLWTEKWLELFKL